MELGPESCPELSVGSSAQHVTPSPNMWPLHLPWICWAFAVPQLRLEATARALGFAGWQGTMRAGGKPERGGREAALPLSFLSVGRGSGLCGLTGPLGWVAQVSSQHGFLPRRHTSPTGSSALASPLWTVCPALLAAKPQVHRAPAEAWSALRLPALLGSLLEEGGFEFGGGLSPEDQVPRKVGAAPITESVPGWGVPWGTWGWHAQGEPEHMVDMLLWVMHIECGLRDCV